MVHTHHTPARPETRSARTPTSWLSSLRGGIGVLLAMIVLVPLLMSHDPHATGLKLGAFELLGVALLAVTIAGSRGGWDTFKQALTAGPNLPILLLLGLAGVSYLVSPYKGYSGMELARLGICALAYFTLVYQLRGRAQLRVVADGLLAVAAVVALLGISDLANDGAINVVTGTFGTHELLGSFLMLLLPLALAIGLSVGGETKKVDTKRQNADTNRQLAGQAVALLVAACLLMARTRSAWAGAAVSLALLSFLAWHFRPTSRRGVRATFAQRKHMVIGPLLILACALAVFVSLSDAGGSLSARAATFTRVDTDDSFQTRLAMWQGAAHMIAARPVFGWGVGTYPVLQAAWTGIGDPAAQVLAHGTSHTNLAHNYYLQTAAETGLVGLGLYLAALVTFFVTGLRALGTMQEGTRKTILIGCLAAMAGQVVDAVGSPAYNFAAVSLFQWVILGLGMFTAGIGVRQGTSDTAMDAEEAAPAPAWTTRARPARYALAACAVLATLLALAPTTGHAVSDLCLVTPAPVVTVTPTGGHHAAQ